MRTLPYRWLGVLLVILTVVAVGAAHGQPAPAPAPDGRPTAPRTIVVNGEGAVDAVPDRAVVALAVVVLRPTAQEAQRESAATMTRIVAKVLALGLPQSAVRTTTVSLFPQRRPEGPITGYQAENRVIVTVDDLSRVGQVIDTGVAAGANNVDSLEWELRDPGVYRTQALRLAVQNARATATAIAEAAGVGGLRLLRIEEAGAIPVPRPRIAMTQAVAGTPVLPGTVSVVMEVRAVYAF